MTSPTNGWATSDLSVYFQRSYTASVRSPTRSLPSKATATVESASPSPSSSINVGAIAGGAAAGGVVLIASIASIACCCIRRIRRRKRHVLGRGIEVATSEQVISLSPPKSTIVGHDHARDAPRSVASESPLSPRTSPPPPWFQSFLPNSQENKWQTAVSQPVANPLQPDHRQTYYPPPPDPQRDDEVQIVHEMSGNRSPAQLQGIPSVLTSQVSRAPDGGTLAGM